MKSGPDNLRCCSSQRREVRWPKSCDRRRRRERLWIVIPVDIVRPANRILPWHQEGVAVRARPRATGAADRHRVAVLKREDVIETPAPDQGVAYAAQASEEVFALAEWQLITAAEVEDVPHVEISQPIVFPNAEPGNVRSAEAPITTTIEQVMGVGADLGVSVRSKEVQTVVVSPRPFELQRMVIAAAFRRRITGASSEILEGLMVIGVQTGGHELSHVVRPREGLQVARQRAHIAQVNGVIWRQLVLQSEIKRLGIRSNVLELYAPQRKPAGIHDRRIERDAGETRLKGPNPAD